jgi:hypothetical protein
MGGTSFFDDPSRTGVRGHPPLGPRLNYTRHELAEEQAGSGWPFLPWGMAGSGVKPAAACLLGQAKRHALMPTSATHRLPDAKEAGGRYRRESHKIAYTPHRNATVIARLGGLGLAQDGAR